MASSPWSFTSNWAVVGETCLEMDENSDQNQDDDDLLSMFLGTLDLAGLGYELPTLFVGRFRTLMAK